MFLPSCCQIKEVFCHVHAKSKKFLPKFMVHATTQKFMKMIKSMNFVHDMAALFYPGMRRVKVLNKYKAVDTRCEVVRL